MNLNKKVLLWNTLLFVGYLVWTLVSSPYAGEMVLIVGLPFWFIHGILLIIIGSVVSFKKNLKNGSIYFATFGLIFILGIVSYLVMNIIDTSNPAFFLLSS